MSVELEAIDRQFVTNAADKLGKSSRAVTDYRPPFYGLLQQQQQREMRMIV